MYGTNLAACSPHVLKDTDHLCVEQRPHIHTTLLLRVVRWGRVLIFSNPSPIPVYTEVTRSIKRGETIKRNPSHEL